MHVGIKETNGEPKRVRINRITEPVYEVIEIDTQCENNYNLIL